MSGMAGNVSAFATVWTYDIYRAMIRKSAPDAHYVSMGRWCTIVGVLVSIGTAYLVMHFAQHHGLRAGAFQLLHRAAFRHGDARHAVEARHAGRRILGTARRHRLRHRLVGLGAKIDPAAFRYVALSPDAKAMAENMFRALVVVA